MHLVLSVLILYTLTSTYMHILHSFLCVFPNVLTRRICSIIKSFFSLVIVSSIHSHDNNDNLGIILQGEISCLSLFGVKGSEKVYV